MEYRENHIMVYEDILMILSKISYKHWGFHLQEKGSGWTIKCLWMAACNNTTEIKEQSGRKWYISPYMCHSEVVRTIYKAIVTAEMHELDEQFLYKGVAIYDPHRDIEELTLLSKKDVRD